jgi:sugar phosphate isomerase/epimerase
MRFGVSVAGQDPVQLLEKWKGRVALIHLKDKAPGLKTHYAESLSPNAFREVGLGVLDFAKIIPAGVQHFFVEQDEVAEDPVESLKQSYRAFVEAAISIEPLHVVVPALIPATRAA